MTRTSSVTLDKELYRQAYEQYRQWIEKGLADLPRNLDKPSPAELWHEYLVAMADFDWDALPESVDWMRVQHLADLDHWYACVFKLEAWRRQHGRTS